MDFMKLSPEKAAAIKLDIYLLAGQSNASGTTKIALAELSERDLTQHELVRYYGNRMNTDGTPVSPHTDFPPVQEGLGNDETRIGPELGMGQALEGRCGENHLAVVLKTAAGGTSMRYNGEILPPSEVGLDRYRTRGSWCATCKDKSGSDDPHRAANFLTRRAKIDIRECYEKLLSLGFRAENIRFCALCWMQGETDRKHPDDYAEYFFATMNELRASLSETTGKDYTKLPLIVGEISESFQSALPENVAINRAFIACQHRLSEQDSTVIVIPTGKFQLCKFENGENIRIADDAMHWLYRDMLPIGRLFGDAAYRASHEK